jgi:transcription initiation factor IIE alpha subunit
MPRWSPNQTRATREAVLGVLRALPPGVEVSAGEVARACSIDSKAVRYVLDALKLQRVVACRAERGALRVNRRLRWSLLGGAA